MVPCWNSGAAPGGFLFRLRVQECQSSVSIVPRGCSIAQRNGSPRRVTTGNRGKRRLQLIRGDIRFLPFERGSFRTVLAPHGIPQSLVRDRDLNATLAAVATFRTRRPVWRRLSAGRSNGREYSNSIQLKGRAAGGSHLTLVESVSQDRKRHLTIFEQTYVERRGRELKEHTFDLTFRTLPIPVFTRRLEKAGFAIEAVLGDYRGGPWDERADVWIMLARRL